MYNHSGIGRTDWDFELELDSGVTVKGVVKYVMVCLCRSRCPHHCPDILFERLPQKESNQNDILELAFEYRGACSWGELEIEEARVFVKLDLDGKTRFIRLVLQSEIATEEPEDRRHYDLYALLDLRKLINLLKGILPNPEKCMKYMTESDPFKCTDKPDHSS